MVVDPTWSFEEQYWQEGIALVAGVDEVGMGALAGPVVAGAALFKPGTVFEVPIRDSKALSGKQREKAAQWIQAHALAWAVGEATVDEISELNIRMAARLAMRRAVHDLEALPELLLVDGTESEIVKNIPAVSIVKGDQLCCSVAAASVLAKVHRDHILVQLDNQYPGYGFASHKGYGSAAHLKALKELGATPAHRPTYAPVAAVIR